MIRVTHVLDDAAGWEQRIGLTHLLDRLPRDRFTQSVVSLGPLPGPIRRRLPARVNQLPCVTAGGPLAAPVLSRYLQRNEADLLHVWGVRAAATARMLSEPPVALSLYDPLVAANGARVIRTIARSSRFAVVCACATVRRRLVEHGVPPGATVLVRPGVDFGLINTVRRGPLRAKLGIAQDEFVSVVPEPISPAGEQFDASYGVALRRMLHGRHRVLLPGRSREVKRILAFHRGLPVRDTLIAAGDRHPFEQLVSVADALLITPNGDAAIGAIPWAMASGAVVIGTAVYAVAEVVAHKVNGLLFKRERGQGASPAVYRLLAEESAFVSCREAARGQAYEVFGLRRFAEQIMRVYRNVLSGKAPADGVSDPAATA